MEVGRLTIRTTENGVSGSLYLHFLDADLVVFPVEPKTPGPAKAGDP